MKTLIKSLLTLFVLFAMTACGSSDGNSSGSSMPPSSITLRVSAGHGSAALIRTDVNNYVKQTKLWTWGDNHNYQLGDLSGVNQDIPITIDAPVVVATGQETMWENVAAGGYHMIAVSIAKDNGDRILWGWGANESGQAGHWYLGSDVVKPSQIGLDTHWDFLSAGLYHSTAIKNDGTLHTWGDNQYGQLGYPGAFSSEPLQVGPNSDWSFVSAGHYHTLAIKALPYGVQTNPGRLYAWGRNTWGQCGNGESGNNLGEPELISSGWKHVSAGYTQSAGVKRDGTLWAWGGSGLTAYLGDGTRMGSATPVQVGIDSDWEMVAVGGNAYHTLALKTDGSLWAWGPNHSGTIGNGSSSGEVLSPVEIQPGTDWTSIAAGDSFGLALKQGVTMDNPYAWGDNGYGQLGVGCCDDSNVPMEVELY